jgi:hypothetical protein
MAVPRKLVVVPNAPNALSAASRELWRIAETGEMAELEAVLSRADINARNEHGMTALMRAAYHGRVQMVRVLLENGADPNVARNDNFTALSLAAFFGHAEIVEILIDHGAKTDVATRFGTSPYIWAKARSFGDVARSLEKRSHETKERVIERPLPRPRSAATPTPAPIVVKTLKDPPEIWDLVQEAPRNFDARAAFVARMGSVKVSVTIAIVLLVVISAGAGAMFYLKNRVRVVSTPAPAAAAATVPVPETPAVATEPQESEVNPEVNLTANPNTSARRSRSFVKPRSVSSAVNNEPSPIETAVAQPTVAATKTEPRSSATPDTKKQTSPLSSQIISPKTTQPKAKVIQWP